MALQVRKLQEKGKRPLRESNCEVFYFLVTISKLFQFPLFWQFIYNPLFLQFTIQQEWLQNKWMQHQGSIDQ